MAEVSEADSTQSLREFAVERLDVDLMGVSPAKRLAEGPEGGRPTVHHRGDHLLEAHRDDCAQTPGGRRPKGASPRTAVWIGLWAAGKPERIHRVGTLDEDVFPVECSQGPEKVLERQPLDLAVLPREEAVIGRSALG